MNLSERISTPSKFFSTPSELVKNVKLSKEQKIKALENWKNSLVQRYEGEEEGMTYISKKTDINKVNKALEELN